MEGEPGLEPSALEVERKDALGPLHKTLQPMKKRESGRRREGGRNDGGRGGGRGGCKSREKKSKEPAEREQAAGNPTSPLALMVSLVYHLFGFGMLSTTPTSAIFQFFRYWRYEL